MRKEGIVFLGIIWLVGAMVAYAEQAINAFLMFLMAGVIPGTQFAFSSGIMFFASTTLLIALFVWSLGDKLRALWKRYQRSPQSGYFARRRFRQIETQ
jgi:hypothetical protein